MSYSSVRIEVPHIKTCKIIRKAEEGICFDLIVIILRLRRSDGNSSSVESG